MAESELHITLVRHLFSWVRDNLFDGDAGNIYVDLPEMLRCAKPTNLICGVRPDLSARRRENNLLVLGEAKTATDLETRHSILQYNSYIEECESYPGPAMIVLAVPWHARRTAHNLLLSLLREKASRKTQIHVLDNLPG